MDPPTTSDRIIILTDSRQLVPCPGCALESDLSPTALADTILRLYGSTASGFIQSSHVASYTLRDLNAYLQGASIPDLEKTLTNSTIIIAMIRNPVANQPDTSAFQTFLAQRPDVVRNKRIIVFALDAPYYLDSTEISKIDGYYALYSKTGACIETAARLLFRDAALQGMSPVSVEGVGYDLLTVLSPDPKQLIPINVGRARPNNPGPTPSPAQTPTGTVSPETFSMGDTLELSAGPVFDRNQHLVPDGTVIRFQIVFPNEKIPPLFLDSTSTNGIGIVEYKLDRQGEIQVTAFSDPAMNSTILKLSTGEQPIFMTPTSADSQTGKTPTAGQAGSLTPQATPGGESTSSRSGLDTLGATILLLIFLTGVGVIVIMLLIPGQLPWRLALCALVGGLAGYDYIAMGFPGADWLVGLSGPWISVLMGGIGCVVGMAAGVAFGPLRARLRRIRKPG
jgi:beta-N-acetylhexosaminidase